MNLYDYCIVGPGNFLHRDFDWKELADFAGMCLLIAFLVVGVWL